MARVSIEDCLSHVENRFELVLIAARRARQLLMGDESRVDWENDKATVVALRELAEEKIDPETIRNISILPKPDKLLEDMVADAGLDE